MGYIRKKLIVFTLLLFSTVALLTGCTKDKYKNLKLDVDKTDIEIVLSDNDEENVFSITSTVSKLPKGYDGAVSFTMPVNDFIEEVDVAPQVNNGVSTAYYKAKKQGGPVIITVKTTEGNLEKQVTVKVTKPITSLNFTQTTIPVVKGERTDISKFISFNPNGTTQNGIKLELTSGDQTNELIKIVTDGQYLTVPSDCTLTSFQVRARSTYNDQLATEVANVKVVTIVDKENISLIYNNNTPNTTEDDVALTKNSKGEYNLVLATNAEDNYTKTIYFNFDNKVSENTNYTVTVKGLQDDGSIIDNNVVNSIVQVDKTLNAINSFDIKAIGNGSTQIKFIIERADFPGYEPFRQTITLNIKSESFPTNITVTNGSNNQSLDEIKLYANYNESASIFGTRFRINVSNETGVMTNQNVILTLSSGGNFIQLYDRFKNAIAFNTPISSNADYYMAHTFTTAPTAKITLTITSATFDKIVTTIPINIETDPLVLSTTQPELNIDINHKEIETPLSIDGISVSAFDTLKVELVNEDGVDASKYLKYTQTNTSITLSPISDEIGECKVKVSAENGSEVVFTVILFESLNADTTTVKIAGQILSAKTEVGGYSPTVVVKNGLNIPVSFTVNGRNYTTLDNTGLRFSINSSNTQIVKVPNYHSVETQNAPGTSMITVSIIGFNEFGEQNKTLYFQISLTVSIPLTSLTTTTPEVTRYDTATLTANQRTQYGTYDIVLYSSPVNATIDYDSIDWTFTIDNVEYIYGQSPSVAKLIDTTNKIITYTFTYRSTCIVTLTTSMTNFRKATVECLIRESTIDSLYFKVNAKVQQSFTNENGVTITSPKQASVRMIIKKAKSVSDYFFTNITEYTIAGTNDKYSEVVFDERDLGYDGEDYTNYNNCLKVVPFTVYPSDALNKNLGASVNNASIEATVDNINGVLNIRILSPFQDSNANVIVKVYPMDNPDTYKEIRVRVLNGKTEQTAFEIKNVEDLIKINTSLNAYYVLTSNIILDSWTPIGYNNGNVRAFNGNFSGTHNIYDANGNVLQSTSYSINGMTITDNELDYYGLFAFVGKDAVIHDLTINDFLIRADINRSVNIYAGALAGYSEGVIRNVVINDGSGVANFNGSYYTTLEKDRTNSGIYITANTITTEQSYFFVGGLVGFANGSKYLSDGTFDSKQYYEINNNYIESTVKIVDTTANNDDYELYSNADIYNVYSTTQLNVYVKSNNISYVGGLVGFNNKAYIANEDNEDEITFGKDSANVITSINASLTDEQITNNINSAFGGVVGFNNGVVSNVIVKADIIGESENENNEEYYMSNIGGVVGYNVGTIKGTTSYPLLRGYYNVGGIVGKSETAIVHIDNTIRLTTDGAEKTYSFINGIGLNDSISSEFLQADKINFNNNFRIKLEKFSNESYDYDGIKQLFKSQFFGDLTDSVIETNINTLYNLDGNIIPDTFTVVRIDYVDLLSKETTTDYSVATTYQNLSGLEELKSHYYNNAFTTFTIALKLANSGINTVVDNDVEFLNLEDTIKEYNTAIIGYNNVGGAIGQYVGLVGLGDGGDNINNATLSNYSLVNYYYSSFNSDLKIAATFNYAIYNPIAYNTVYNYTGLKVVPVNETGYTGGYYGNILLSNAHSQSVSNSHRNYAGGLVGYMSNSVITNSQVFADIQGRLAGLGGIVGKTEGITQINNTSYIGLIHNKTTGTTEDATAATGGIVGDALNATTTFAYFSEYNRSDSTKVNYTYIASPINIVQYESKIFKKSLAMIPKQTIYNNISNSYFMANTLNSGYIETVKPFDSKTLEDKTEFDKVILKLAYYNNTSNGFVGEGKQEIKQVISAYSAGKMEKQWFNSDGTKANPNDIGATDYLLTKADSLKVNFEYLQNSIQGKSIDQNSGTTCTILNENAYGIDNSESDAQMVIAKFAAKTIKGTDYTQLITYNASNETSETGLVITTDGGILGPDSFRYIVPTSRQYWYLNKQVNNGLPVLLSRQKAIYSARTIIEDNQERTETIVNRVDLLVNFPPTAINVDYTQNYVDTFIADINSEKTAVISYYELSQDSYDSTGTTIDFGNNNQYSQSAIKNFTNTLSSRLRERNTYGYSEILNITTIPKFINANSVKVVSSNTSKLSVERGNDGKYKFIAKGTGVVELTVTSAYDPSKTKTIIVNIIYASKQLDLSYNNSGKTESIKGLAGKTIDLNKNSSTNPSNVSIKSDMKSTYNFASSGGDVNKTFNLVSNYDGGIRYYYLTKKNIDGNNVSSIYWVSGGEDPTNSGITVNDQQLTTESVKYLDKDNNEQTNYVYYYDVPLSMEAKFKGSNIIQADFVAIPYVNVYDANGNAYKKPLIELSSNVSSTIEMDGKKLCGLSSVNSDQLNFLKSIIHSFTINVKDINTGLVSSVNSININADMEPTFDVEIETYKSDEDLYITYQDSNYVEHINKIIKDTPIQIADMTLLCTAKDTSTQGVIRYTFNLYVSPDNKSNITSSYTKNLRFFVLKDGVEVTSDEKGFVNAELHSIVDTKLNITIPVTINPQPINEIIIRHYPNSEITVTTDDNGKKITNVNLNEIAYDNIIPGHVGILKVYISPEYAYYDRVEIVSSVDANTVVQFEQMVANATETEYGIYYTGNYETLVTDYVSINNGITLQKNSYINQNNQIVYNGYLYIRTLINSFVTDTNSFTLTVRVYKNGSDTPIKTQSITLNVQAPPSLTMSMTDGSSVGVVARGTEQEFAVKTNGFDGVVDFSESYLYRISNVSGSEIVLGEINSQFSVKYSNNKYYLVTDVNLEYGNYIKLIGKASKSINGEIITSEAELTVKIVDYIIEEISVENMSDGYITGLFNQPYALVLRISKAKYNSSLSALVNDKIRTLEKRYSQATHVSAGSTEYNKPYIWYSVDTSKTNANSGRYVSLNMGRNSTESYIINAIDNYLDLDNISVYTVQNIKFGSGDTLAGRIKYVYDTTDIKPILDDSDQVVYKDNDYYYERECEFKFNFYRFRDEEHPDPIQTAEQLKNMEDGVDYILVNDITLTDWTPLRSDLKINSLDGNGYVIKIESFNLESYADDKELIDNVNIGIFSKINSGTTIKNLIIEVAPKSTNSNVELANYDGTDVDLYVDARAYKNVTFGLLAAENAGLITNVQVVYNADSLKEERENITKQYNYTTNITKNGSIRRDLSVIRIETTTTVESQTHYMAGLVARNLDEGESAVGSITNSSIDNISINGVGYVSGFVVENNGKISSSFYRGGNIINRIAENYNESATSGFAIYNSGNNAAIQYSYTQGRTGEGANGTTYAGESLNGTYDKTALDNNIKNTFAGYNYANGEGKLDSIVSLRAMNSMIDTKSNASAFIFENNAEVSNCYANILVNSVMSTSGFVFSNKANGTISSSYTLSSVKLNDYSSSPFTGRGDQSNYNNENPTGYSDTHYLKLGSDDNASEAEKNYREEFLDSEEPATYLGASQFKEYNTFQSYAFNTDFETNSVEKVTRAVWFIPNSSSQNELYGDNKTYLKHKKYVQGRPELVAANLHTVSIKVWTSKDETSNENSYVYASTPIGESIQNPILIRTAEEFNNYLVYDSSSVDDTNRKFAIRFISDIAFNKTDLSAKTYTMDYSGDLDGNGMTIEHLRLLSDTDFETDESANSQKTVEYLGLFKRIYTSYTSKDKKEGQRGVVRNLNLVVDEVRGSKVTYVGVLAGSVEDGDVFNIDISGSSDSVYVQGRNIVGGLTGLVTGDSQIVNITSSINVQSTYFKYSNLFSSKNPDIDTSKYGTFEIYDRTLPTDGTVVEGVNNKTEISYVGGIVGIFDSDPQESDDEENPLSLFNAKARKLKVTGNAKLSGEIVGGVIGLVGYTSKVSDITFIVEENATPKIYATRVAGGLIGENRGKIERSYISHSKTLQDKIDAEYKNAVSRSSANIIVYSSTSNYDSLFGRNAHYTGGVIGFNNKGTVENCYSRINVINKDSLYAGGFTGWDISGTYQYCYTTGSVSAYNSVGGFIGLLNRNQYKSDDLVWIDENFITKDSGDNKNSRNIGRGQRTLETSTASLTKLNGVNALNIWRKEDLSNDRSDSSLGKLNIGAYVGKVVSITTSKPNISDVFDYSTERTSQAKETNYFIQNSISDVKNSNIAMTEIGVLKYGGNLTLSYVNTNDGYKYYTMFADDIRSTKAESVNKFGTDNHTYPVKSDAYDSELFENYINDNRIYGISGYAIEGYTEIINGETQQKYKSRLYSRMLNIGSGRTLKEVINTLDVINSEAKSFGDQYEAKETGNRFVNNSNTINIDTTDNYSIYYIWSRTRWTGVEKTTAADLATVFPYLEAKPERTVIEVRTVEDLKLMNTYRTAEFVLMNDITFNNNETWEPVGSMSQPFRGWLHSYKDGDKQNEYSINNLRISRNSMSSLFAGLVGYASEAKFEYFDLNNVNINVSTSATADVSIQDGSLFIGALVGYSDAGTSIKNVDMTTCSIQTDRAGTIGGLIGYSGLGTIENSTISKLTIAVKGLGDTSKANNDSAKTLAFGGLVGMITSASADSNIISNANVTGNISLTDSSIRENSISESESRLFDIGGLVGRVNDSDHTTMAKIAKINVNVYTNYNLDFANDNKAIKDVSVGGIIGSAINAKLIAEGETNNTVSKGKVDNLMSITNYSNNFNMGGAIGRITGLTNNNISDNIYDMSNIQILTSLFFDNSDAWQKLSATNCGNMTANIGGAVGYAENATFSNVYADTNWEITNNTSTENATYNIGGLFGYINNSQNIDTMYSKGSIKFTANNGINNIGGAFGQVVMARSDEYSYSINKVVADNDIKVTFKTNNGTGNIGGFVGKIYNGVITESSTTSDITVVGSDISNANLYVGGFVGTTDITNEMGYLRNTKVRKITINDCYATTDIDLGNMFKDTTKHKAGLFVGAITTNDTDTKDKTININNNYTIGKFVYKTINTSAYEERENKGGFLGGFNTNIATLSYISKLKNIVMYNNIYNRDFVSYTNEYGDAKSTKEMLFNSVNTFNGLTVNNSFIDTNKWVINNDSYPQLKWINNTKVAEKNIEDLQADGTKVVPDYYDSSITLNGASNKTYILNTNNATLNGNFVNTTIYFNTNTKQTTLSSWSNVTLDYKTVVYGINTNVNSLSTMLVTTNNGLIVDTAIPNNLVGTNNGIIYQVTTIGTALSTASNNIVGTNTGIIDSINVMSDNVLGHIYNTSTGILYRSVVKTTKSGGFNNVNKGTIKDSYIRTGNNTSYYYVYYDRKGNEYKYDATNNKDIIELVNVLDRDSFDMVEDWTVIKGRNDGQPMLQSELKGTDTGSGKVNFYGDITNDYKWGTGISDADVKTLAPRIGKSTATHINVINGIRSGANSNDITLSELMGITTNGIVDSTTQEESDISNDTNANNAYYIDSVVNEELNTTDNLRILTIKEYNFGIVTTTKKRIANIANKDFWLKEDINLSGRLWTPMGVGYNNYILGKDESVNTNTSYVNQISYPFNGTIAGNGYKITNMSVVGVNSNVGLFGAITSDGTNLSDSILRGMLLTNSTIISVADNGYAVAGALAGRIIVPSLSGSNNTFNAYTKVGTQQANVYGSTRASGLIGDVLSLNSNFKPLEMTYSYVNSDVITSNDGFASAFINMGNDYTNSTSGSYTNTSINASVKEFYMAGSVYINGVISDKNRQNENNSHSSLFGNFETNKQETIRSVYALNYNDSKKSTNIVSIDGYSSSDILKTKDLDYFTWGNIWTRISTTTSNDPEIYNEGYPVLKNEIDYWALHTEEVNLDSQTHIKNAGQLAKIAELVNTNRFGVGYTIILDNDIDLSGKIWTPIGYNQSRTFKGVFDFNGHSITGITITGVYLKSESTTSEKVVTVVETSDNKVEGLGLFGYLGNEATIKSTNGVGTLGKSGDNSRIIGIGNVGALVGKAEETEIKNVVNNINVSSPTTESNRPTNGQSNYGVGGLIGHLVAKQSQEVVYENLTNNGNVTSTRPNVGGIIGYLYSKTTSSYKTTLKNFANNGAVYSSTSDAKNIGGLIGYNDGVNIDINGYDDTISNYSSITKNINIGAITGYEKVGGIVGYSTSGSIQNIINKGSIYATNGIAGGIVGEMDNMEVFEVINNAEIGCGENGNAIASIIGKLNGSRKSTISNLFNMYQAQNNDNNKYYGLVGTISGNYDFYTALDMATGTMGSIVYGGTSLENVNSRNNGANNHIIINKMFVYDKRLLSEYPTDIYDGSKYATYLDVFNDNLLWDLNASDGYYLRFNTQISGEKLDPIGGKYIPTTQGHFNYLSDMNRKRFGVPCITYPIELSQNITLNSHKPLGKGAYPWKNNINGNNNTITISGFVSGSESQSLLGNVSGTTVNNVVLSYLKIKYNISTIDKNSGFLMDTGFATNINNVEISQSDVDTISVSGVDCFGTIATKLTSSTLVGVTNKQKLSTSSVSYVGGLVGELKNSNLNNCSNLSNITATNSTALGGLVGNAIGELDSSNSINNSSVAVDSTTSYTIDGNNYVGGIVGKSQQYRYYNNTFGTTKFSSNKFQGRNGFVKGDTIGGIIGTSDKDYICENKTYGEIITTNIGGGIVGQATGNGSSFPNNSAVIYRCENNSIVETSSNGKIVGGIVGVTKNKITINECVNNVYGEVLSYKDAGGIVGNAYSTNITNCFHEGYSSSIGLSTETRIGGIAGYLSNSTLDNAKVSGYVGVQAYKNSAKRYNNYYSIYNMDNADYNYNTFSYNSYNEKQGDYGKSNKPDGTYRYAYLYAQSSNVTNKYNNTIDPQYSKFEIYDYYVNVTTGHADGWFGLGYANINIDVMQRYGELSSDGYTPITLVTSKIDNKKAEKRSVWFGYIDYASVSVTVKFSAFGTSTFPANSDLERFKITYVDSHNIYNFSQYYYEGDSLYLPMYDGTDSTLDEWYTQSTGGTKIDSTYKVAKNGIITFTGTDNSATIYARWSPKKWIVTLGNTYDAKDSGDMSAIGSISVVSGKTIDWTFKDYSNIASKITADPTDEKEGYRVLSWHTNSVSSWNDLVNKANNGDNYNERKSAQNYLEGDPDSENGGLGLKRWEDARVITSPWTAAQKTDSMYYKTEFDKNTAITENISLFAYYIPIYQVKFDYNWKTDSGVDGQTSTKVKVDAGEKVSAVKNPTRTGYTFKKWCTNQSGTQEFDFNTPITKNTVLYAKWEVQKLDVKFVYGLDGKTSQVKKIDYNTALKNTDVPTEANIDGYSITWKDARNNVVKFDGTYKITSNTTITAYYEKMSYTVVFKVNGSNYIEPITVYYGDKVLEPEHPTSSNPLEVFDYWCTDESLTKKYNFNSAVTDNLTLYAKFKTAQVNVTYKFVDSTSTAITGKSDYKITIDSGTTITRPSNTDTNFVIDGYELEGFFTDTSFTSQYDFSAKVTTEQVIYVQYVKTYAVTFVVGARYTGGEPTNKTITVRIGNHIPTDSVPQVLTNVNKFGWLYVEDDTYSGEVNFDTYTVSADISLYYYASNNVQIVYKLEEDSDYTLFKSYSDIQYGSSVDRPDTDLEVEGYRFGGYYSDDTYTSEFNFGTDIITAKDTKIYVKMIKQINIEFAPYDEASADASIPPTKSFKIDKGSIVSESDWIKFISQVDSSDIVWYYTDSTHTEKTETTLSELQSKSFTEDTVIYYKWNRGN